MSNHECPVVPIVLRKHPNADSLSLVDVYGYQVCVKTAEFINCNLAAFIPPDYIIDSSLAEFAWLKGHERIKVRKMRGERSEGLLIPAKDHWREGDNVMKELNIRRWESPADRDAEKIKRPQYHWWQWRYWWSKIVGVKEDYQRRKASPGFHVHQYDVENYRRFPVIEEGEHVWITEKIHGTNARFVYSTRTGRFHIGSHKQWKPIGGVDWWNKAVEQNSGIERLCRENPDCVFYGEVYGRSVQPLGYGNPKGTFGIALFDIYEVGVGWATPHRIHDYWFKDDFIQDHWVPTIFCGRWDKSLESYCEGKTTFPADHIREGCVIETYTPRTISFLGRVKLKLINPAYLDIPEDDRSSHKEFNSDSR